MKLNGHIRYPRATPTTSWSPHQVLPAYGFTKPLTAVKAVTIGIIELGGGETPSDTATAFATWKLPAPRVTNVGVQGGQNAPGDDADGEVALDLQVAAGTFSALTGLPATVRMYYAPNSDSGFAAAIRQARQDGCDTISISWGGPEDAWPASAMQAMDKELAACRAAGIPVFVAAGDNGSSDGEPGVHVDFPASSPNAIGCGGTRKPATGAETVWSGARGEGTGGGYSSAFIPQQWQIGAPTGPGRMVPDVSAVADPGTGWDVYLSGWQVIGGTSAVAPFYAGLWAAFKASGATMPADPLAWVWSHPASFSDVTSGSNGQWRAAVGPDPCTGLGVPNGSTFAQMFAVVTVPPPASPPPPVSPPVSPPTPTGPMQGVLSFRLFGIPITTQATFTPTATGAHAGIGGVVGKGQIVNAIVSILKAAGVSVGHGELVKVALLVAVEMAQGKPTEQIITDVLAVLLPQTSLTSAAAPHFTMPSLGTVFALLGKYGPEVYTLVEEILTDLGGVPAIAA